MVSTAHDDFFPGRLISDNLLIAYEIAGISCLKANGELDFPDVKDFNQALLSKQAWRLLNEVKYFANKSFMECGKGYTPSYA